MSIDQASAPVPAHPVARAGTGRAAPGHSARSGNAGAELPSSFENLLNALSAGSDDSGGSDTALAMAAELPAALQEAPADMPPGTAPSTPAEAIAGTSPIPWLAALDAMQTSSDPPAATSTALPLAPPDGPIGRTPGAVADPSQASAPRSATRGRALEFAEGPAGKGGGVKASDAAVPAGLGAAEVSKAVVEGRSGDDQSGPASASAVRHAVPRPVDMPQALVGRADLKDAAPQATLESVIRSAAVGVDPATVSRARPARESERRELAPGTGMAVHGPDAGPTFQSGGLTSYALTAPDASVATGSVAEKLFYWVTGGVQNAELQVDAFGGGSVEVSVSVQGNEAMVEFRSDQPEARRVLQDAMPQLRSMLREEGLLLSGGFVGTSARDGADPSPRRRPDTPQGIVSLTQTSTEPGRVVTGVTRVSMAGGRLDVFV